MKSSSSSNKKRVYSPSEEDFNDDSHSQPCPIDCSPCYRKACKLGLSIQTNVPIEKGLCPAASGGHLELLRRIAPSCDMRIIDDAMVTAASYGQEEAMLYLLSLGATSLERAFVRACRRGHVRICELLVERGAQAFAHALVYTKMTKNQKGLQFLSKFLDLEPDFPNLFTRHKMALVHVIGHHDLSMKFIHEFMIGMY